jgi:LAO/AO transport system kinase
LEEERLRRKAAEAELQRNLKELSEKLLADLQRVKDKVTEQIGKVRGELQGIKKGVMELADAVLVNKADGGNALKAEGTRVEYDRILHFLRPATEGWETKAHTCSAADGTGIDEMWGVIESFMQTVKASGVFAERRKQQTLSWVYTMVEDYIKQKFYNCEAVARERPSVENQVTNGVLSATEAASELIKLYEGSAG